jgi:transposase
MYSQDFRKLALRVYKALGSLRKSEAATGISRASIARWAKGGILPKIQRHQAPKTEAVTQVIRDVIVCNPLHTVRQFRTRISESMGIAVSNSLIKTVVRALGYTRKKAHFYGYSKNVEDRTRSFISERADALASGKNFVAIDETSFGRKSYMARGYAPKGEKLFVRKNTPRVTTTSVVACVSSSGLIHRKAVEGSFNKVLFLEFLKELDLPRGTQVLLDNVKFHHSKPVQEYAQTAGLRLLYTPPYSPWFNPIENCFSVVKRAFYRGETIDASFDALEPRHCASFFANGLALTGPQ